MDDPVDLTVLKSMIAQAVDLCTDTLLLDLVYKLLVTDSSTAQ